MAAVAAAEYALAREACDLCVARASAGYVPPENAALTHLGVPRSLHPETRRCVCAVAGIAAQVAGVMKDVPGQEDFVAHMGTYAKCSRLLMPDKFALDSLQKEVKVKDLAEFAPEDFRSGEELKKLHVYQQDSGALHVSVKRPLWHETFSGFEFVKAIHDPRFADRGDRRGYDPFKLGPAWQLLPVGTEDWARHVGAGTCCSGASRRHDEADKEAHLPNGSHFFHGRVGDRAAAFFAFGSLGVVNEACVTRISTPGSCIVPVHVDSTGARTVKVQYPGRVQLLLMPGCSVVVNDVTYTPEDDRPIVVTSHGGIIAKVLAGPKFFWVRPMTKEQMTDYDFVSRLRHSRFLAFKAYYKPLQAMAVCDVIAEHQSVSYSTVMWNSDGEGDPDSVKSDDKPGIIEKRFSCIGGLKVHGASMGSVIVHPVEAPGDLRVGGAVLRPGQKMAVTPFSQVVCKGVAATVGCAYDEYVMDSDGEAYL